MLEGKVARPQMPEMLTEKEHLPPREGPPKKAGSRPDGSDAMTVSQASLKDGYGVVLDSIFPLPLVHDLGSHGYLTRDARKM